MSDYKTIAESKNFIVLEQYTQEWKVAESYQSESDLERELISDLRNQGYEYLPSLTEPDAMLANVRVQLQALNNVQFSNAEWRRFVEGWLDKPSDGIVEKTRKIHDDYVHDFVFDDGRIQNIHLLDKKNIACNKLQVIRQFEQTGTHANRYDVTILVNGLPLVQVELKKRGVAIREAFNQVHRYSKESFNSEHSLFKYLQVFVISNGTDSRYFANTTQRNKNSFDFTMNWAKADNSLIKDLKDFTATFFQKHTGAWVPVGGSSKATLRSTSMCRSYWSFLSFYPRRQKSLSPRVRRTTSPGIVQSVRRLNPCFSPTPCRRTTAKKSGGSETKRGLRRISGVGGHGVSQEPIAKSPAWCGALSA